nr:MAG TPA: hypothetical protein [Caudoviricetes sp.]
MAVENVISSATINSPFRLLVYYYLVPGFKIYTNG